MQIDKYNIFEELVTRINLLKEIFNEFIDDKVIDIYKEDGITVWKKYHMEVKKFG